MGVYNQYPAGTTPTGPEQFGPVRQGSADVVLTAAQLLAYITPNGSNWSPVLTFGGTNTGMVYTSAGRFVQLGTLVLFTGTLTLSALGSSTGAAVLTLPVQTVSPVRGLALLTGTSGLVSVPNNQISAYVNASGLQLLLGSQDSSSSALTQANISGTATLSFAGFYFTA